MRDHFEIHIFFGSTSLSVDILTPGLYLIQFYKGK